MNYATSDGWSPLLVAARWKHVGIVRCLLDRGASIEQPNSMGFTALCVAAKHNSLGVAKLLVKRKANIDRADKVQWLQQPGVVASMPPPPLPPVHAPHKPCRMH